MSRRAFSIIELLVVIGIVVVLLALAIPAIAEVRLRSYEIKSRSNLSQIGKTVELYAIDYRSYFFGTSGPTRPASVDNPGWVSFPIWNLDLNWPLLVHRVAPWESHYQIWISPRGDDERLLGLISGEHTDSVLPISYHYSNSFVAKPEVWADGAGSGVDASAISSIKPHMVRYPSAKVIVFDAYRPYLVHDPTLQDRRPVLFADGSSKSVLDTDSIAPTTNLLRPNHTPYRYHDTPNGVYGRDF